MPREEDQDRPGGEAEDLDIDLLYAWGDKVQIRKNQARYLSYFQNAPGTILDLGCGRGIMLDLLKKAGLKGYGLDLSEKAVLLCRSKGFDVVQGDALGHLRSLQDRSIGGIFCSHVIEHMQPRDAIEMIHEFRRVVKAGGRLILVTPNASDLMTSERFWLDPTHVRPYPEKLLVLLLERAGFKIIKTTRDKEPNRHFLVGIAKAFLNLWFMGFMFKGDLVVIAARGTGD